MVGIIGGPSALYTIHQMVFFHILVYTKWHIAPLAALFTIYAIYYSNTG